MEIDIKLTITLPDEMSDASVHFLDSYFRPLLKELAGKQNAPAGEETSVEPAPAEETKEPDAGVVIPAEEDDDDLPYSVSNEDLRAAVKDARAKVGSQPIWNLFHKYGINASIDCPDEKRPQFYAELKSLAA